MPDHRMLDNRVLDNRVLDNRMLDNRMLDDLMPDYDFSERHHRRIRAPGDQVWPALADLTLADLTITRPLLAVRQLGRPSDTHRPLLTNGPLQLLDVTTGRYAMAGAVAQPWLPRAPRHDIASIAELLDFDQPGWTKYLTTFRIDPVADGCVLSTETRGISTDANARHRFAMYWALIRVPSGFVRRDVLRSVARRAERRPVAAG